MKMTEQLMHFLWRNRLLRPPLFCVSGEPLEVLHPGESNRNGGPDFFNARIRIGRTVWAGTVEIHVRASDWFRHQHHTDPAYRNVILHVVDTHDAEVTVAGGRSLPAMEMGACHPPEVLERFSMMQSSTLLIPCQNLISEADPAIFRLWAPSLVMERLTSRMEAVGSWQRALSNQWDEMAFQWMAGAFGCRVNAHPFELLARATPLRILNRHRDQVLILESMLFGQANLLDPTHQEGYPVDLFRSYSFYRDKYSLLPLEPGTMKFLRLRPVTFPTIRISQLASLIHRDPGFPGNALEAIPLRERIASLQVQASPYWETHYTFGKISAPRIKNLGDEAILLVLINGLAPVLFHYGVLHNLPAYRERALSMLEDLPGERSALTRCFAAMGITAENALLTQALTQLKRAYCDRKRCLECRIGLKLLGRGW